MKKFMMLLVGCTVFYSTPAYAFDWFGGRLSIGGGVGRAKPKLPYDFQDTYQDGQMWTAHMKYFLNNDVSVVASYADLQPYRRGDKQDVYRFRPIVASLRYNLFHHLPITPYLTAGAGYSINKREAPGMEARKWEGFTWQGGLGFEFFITEGTTLGAEALYHHFSANSGDAGDNFGPHRPISAVGTVNFYFGAGPSKKRTEEALEAEKQRADKAQADAEAARQQAQSAQQGQTEAQAQVLAAQQAAAAAQAQVQQAQSDIEQIKQMVESRKTNPITFKSGSAELQPSSNATLDRVAEIGKKYPTLNLRVEGHTDNTGNEQANQALSEKRAESVKNYLTNAGIPSNQVSSVGFGETRPIASNDTASGRAQNRRVEFIFNAPGGAANQ